MGTMVAGGLLALLIGRRFGTSARTDGLFAAYSVYGIVLTVAQSLRLTMVPRLAQADANRSFVEGLGAIALLGAGSGVLLLALADPLATALVGSGTAHGTARDALMIFWFAAVAQLVAGFGAARLAAAGSFTVTAIGYMTGSFLPVVALAVWPGPHVLLVPVLIVCGAWVIAASMLRSAWLLHPARGHRASLRGSARTAGHMVAGALGSVMWQIALVVSLAFAARLGQGAVTVYSYAFFAAGLVTAVTSGSMGMVLAAPLTAGWDRRDPAALTPALLTVVRTATALVVPVLGVALLLADDVVRLLLGSALSDHQIATLRDAFLVFGGVIVAASISPVPALAAYARQRYWSLASLEFSGLVVHVLLTTAVSAFAGLVAFAAVASVSSWVIALLAVVFIWRAAAPALILQLLVTVLRAVALGAVIFVPLLVATSSSTGLAVAGAAVGVVIYLLAAPRVIPDHFNPVVDALRSLVLR
jgi:peptidoglycan biosynthesis protein MviN/MurJ (putative lipid II flippase)